MRIERKRYWMRRVSWGWSSNGEHGPYRVSDRWWLTLRCIVRTKGEQQEKTQEACDNESTL